MEQPGPSCTTYHMTGVTPSNFLTKHFGYIDYKTLCSNFSLHCDDFDGDLTNIETNKAMEFCYKILFDVYPRFKLVKKTGRDLKCRFKFMVGDVAHTVFVGTYKYTKLTPNDRFTATTMSMTLKEAGLIAITTFFKMIPILLSKDVMLMILFCKAAFSKEKIVDMAAEWGVTLEEALIVVNASSLPGGQYLSESDGTIAALAVYTTTRSMENAAIRERICNETIKEYLDKGKKVDMSLFKKLAKYTN